MMWAPYDVIRPGNHRYSYPCLLENMASSSNDPIDRSAVFGHQGAGVARQAAVQISGGHY